MEDSMISRIEKELGVTVDKVNQLTGDASVRKYYRLFHNHGSYIACEDLPNGQQSRDYISNYRYFSKKVKVPKIYFSDNSISLLVQEDLGDLLLIDHLNELEDQDVLSFYKKAIDSMVLIQDIKPDSSSVFKELYFDKEKLNFEFNLAVEYFLGKHNGIEISSYSETLEKASLDIINYFENCEQVLNHRDYHSKNIMVKNNDLYIIDYQDARHGPRAYDLVSLIKDSYFELSEDIEKRLFDYYIEKTKIANVEQFKKEFLYVTVQRTFKALGSFTYMKHFKDNDSYLRYIPRGVENLISALKGIDELSDFLDIVEKCNENR